MCGTVMDCIQYHNRNRIRFNQMKNFKKNKFNEIIKRFWVQNNIIKNKQNNFEIIQVD